jgi:hypothetical protein
MAALELTVEQSRVIAQLRARFSGAEVRTHQRPWGVIVEIRRDGRTVSLTAFDAVGGVRRAEPLPLAA